MRISVLGATGTIGSLVSKKLEQKGHDVRRVSRSLGYDLTQEAHVQRAVKQADLVIDCLNSDTLSTKKALAFFEGTASRIAAAAQEAGVGRIICLSIHGVNKQAVARGYGYYAGKAAQEAAYQAGAVPVTIIESAQWFELLPVIVSKTTMAGICLLASMRIAPVAAERVASLVADQVEERSEGQHRITIRGPEVLDIKTAVESWLSVKGEIAGLNPRFVFQLPYLGKAIAGGDLVPEEGLVDEVSLSDWLKGTPEGTRPRRGQGYR